MPEDARDYIDDIRDRADVDAQMLERLRDTGPSQGFDDTRSVRADLDGDGNLTGIRVAPDWQRSLRDGELATAVLDAYQQAVMKRLEAWGTSLEESEANPPRPRPRPAVHETMPGRLQERLQERGVSIDDTRTLNRLLEMLEDLDDAMEQAEGDLDMVASTQVTGRSGAGHVTVAISGTGELAGLEFDQRWLPRAHAANIGRETMDALQQARRRLAERAAERPPFAKLTALAALAKDPAALVEFLGIEDAPPSPGSQYPGSYR